MRILFRIPKEFHYNRRKQVRKRCMEFSIDDRKYMELALKEAEQASLLGEVPIGACLVLDGEVIALAHNLKESKQNPLAHAELLSIHEASEKLGTWRLENCTLYVTLEPCPMCASAIQQARIKTLYFASREPKMGAICSTDQFLDRAHLNHKVEWYEGLLAEKSTELLRKFFRKRRLENKKLNESLGGRSKRRLLRENYGKESKGL